MNIQHRTPNNDVASLHYLILLFLKTDSMTSYSMLDVLCGWRSTFFSRHKYKWHRINCEQEKYILAPIGLIPDRAVYELMSS